MHGSKDVTVVRALDCRPPTPSKPPPLAISGHDAESEDPPLYRQRAALSPEGLFETLSLHESDGSRLREKLDEHPGSVCFLGAGPDACRQLQVVLQFRRKPAGVFHTGRDQDRGDGGQGHLGITLRDKLRTLPTNGFSLDCMSPAIPSRSSNCIN